MSQGVIIILHFKYFDFLNCLYKAQEDNGRWRSVLTSSEASRVGHHRGSFFLHSQCTAPPLSLFLFTTSNSEESKVATCQSSPWAEGRSTDEEVEGPKEDRQVGLRESNGCHGYRHIPASPRCHGDLSQRSLLCANLSTIVHLVLPSYEQRVRLEVASH